MDCEPWGVMLDGANRGRQDAALVRNVWNFSDKLSYAEPFQLSSERENCSSMVFRHSIISNPSSLERTRIVAVFAVPAGPARTSMRYTKASQPNIRPSMSLGLTRYFFNFPEGPPSNASMSHCRTSCTLRLCTANSSWPAVSDQTLRFWTACRAMIMIMGKIERKIHTSLAGSY